MDTRRKKSICSTSVYDTIKMIIYIFIMRIEYLNL